MRLSDVHAPIIQRISLNDLVFPRGPLRGDAALGLLAESLRVHGQQEPLLVVPRGEGGFIVVDGRRRVLALRSIGATEVSALVSALPYKVEVTAIVNAHRAEWSRRDRLVLVRELRGQGWKQADIALLLGIDAPEVSKLVGLLDLVDTPVMAALEAGHISVAHAVALAREKDEARRNTLLRETLEHGLRARDVEARVGGAASGDTASTSGGLPADMISLIGGLVGSERRVRVEVRRTVAAGGILRLEVEGLDDEDLAALHVAVRVAIEKYAELKAKQAVTGDETPASYGHGQASQAHAGVAARAAGS